MGIDEISKKIQECLRQIQELESKLIMLQSDYERFKEESQKRLSRTEQRLYRTKKNLTIAEASEYTGFSAHTIYQLTSNHKIKFFKPNGKTIFIPRKDLENWLASNLQYIKEDEEK